MDDIETPKDRALIKRPKGALVEKQGGALVKRQRGALVKPTKGEVGLLAMNGAIERITPALAITERLGRQWHSSICVIGLVGEPRRVELARKIHQQFLAWYAEIDAARRKLWSIEAESIDRAAAMLMLNVLFSAIGKRKNDEEGATLLMAAADMFNPVNDVLASAGLLNPVPKFDRFGRDVEGNEEVKPINRHPAIVAIAIKKLIATAKFTSVAELREAMAHVQRHLGVSAWHLQYMADAIERADEMLFKQEPATWEKLHLRDGVDVTVERAMLEDLEHIESPYLDDDDVEQPGSPRWLAFEEIVKGKETRAVTVREAACKTLPAKRTRKPKAKPLPEAAE